MSHTDDENNGDNVNNIHPFFINWWLENIKKSPSGYITMSDIAQRSGPNPPLGQLHVLKRLFDITIKIQKVNKRTTTCYIGIEVVDRESIKPSVQLDYENFKKLIPDNMVQMRVKDTVIIILPTAYIIDSKRVTIEARITECSWKLVVDGIHVDMAKNGIDCKFHNTVRDIENITTIMSRLTPCTGSPKDFCDNGLVKLQVLNDGSSEWNITRSKYCRGMTGWNTRASFCENCRRHPDLPIKSDED